MPRIRGYTGFFKNIYIMLRHYMMGVVEFETETLFYSLFNFPFPPLKQKPD